MLGANFINILSDDSSETHHNGHISEKFLKNCGIAYDKPFYICGPPPMMEAVEEQLSNLNVKEGQIVKEEY